jgi:hypothetical protein
MNAGITTPLYFLYLCRRSGDPMIQAILTCIQHLASRAEAIYVTALLAIDEYIEPIIGLLKKERIPSFSMYPRKNRIGHESRTQPIR